MIYLDDKTPPCEEDGEKTPVENEDQNPFSADQVKEKLKSYGKNVF